MGREPNRDAGEKAAGIAFPMVANLATLDEFRRGRGDHEVTAMRAPHRGGKGSDGRELRAIFMKLHVMASFSSRLMPMGSGTSWQGRDALMKQ